MLSLSSSLCSTRLQERPINFSSGLDPGPGIMPIVDLGIYLMRCGRKLYIVLLSTSTHNVAASTLAPAGKWGKIYVLSLAAELIKDLFPAHLTRPASRLEMLDALAPSLPLRTLFSSYKCCARTRDTQSDLSYICAEIALPFLPSPSDLTQARF